MRSPLLPAPARPWRRRALRTIALAGTLSCGTDALDPDRSTVASIVVTPDRLSVGVGASAPLTAELRDATGTLIQGRKVVWASKDAALATVSGAGVVTGVAPGPVQIAATAEGKTAVVEVTVNPKAVASVRLTPSGSLGLLVGQTRQMNAEPLDAAGEPLSDRPVTWSTNAATIATVSVDGLITAVAPGGAVVTAASEGKTAVVAVTVSSVPVASVSVAPDKDNLVVGRTLQLTATAKDAAGGTLTGRVISWSTSDPARATVSSTGLVTGVAPGEATISALSEGKTGSSAITVTPKPVAAVIVSPAQVSVEPGQTRSLTVQVTDDQGNVLTGRPVQYASDNTAVATVSSSGVVTGVALGAAKITATSEGKSGTADVTVVPVPVATVQVTPPQSDLAVGQSALLTAVARDARGNVLTGRPVTWITGAPSVATVSSTGTVVGVGPGNALIFATIEGHTASARVDVWQVTSVLVSPTSATVQVGQTRQLTATARNASGATVSGVPFQWTTSAPNRATVDATGLVTGVSAGTATIRASVGTVSGSSTVTVTVPAVATVTVAPSTATVNAGQTLQLTATVRDAQGNQLTRPVSWSSSNNLWATVNNQGLVTTSLLGKNRNVTITATSEGKSGTSAVTIK